MQANHLLFEMKPIKKITEAVFFKYLNYYFSMWSMPNKFTGIGVLYTLRNTVQANPISVCNC